MSPIPATEPFRLEFDCMELGQQLAIIDQAPPRSSKLQSKTPMNRLSRTVESRSMARPTLHHLGLKTSNLDAMVDWYAKVLGMETNHRTSTHSGAQGAGGWKIAWLTNDEANHRITIMALPRLTDDEQRSGHKGLQHIAFAYQTLDDLLATYARLKSLGIEPIRAADHGTTTSFYYEDPDRNSIELLVDNFGDDKQSTEFMRRSPAFAINPMGADVDPDQIYAARNSGMSLAEIHRRAYSGEFCGAGAFYRHCLTAAASQTAVR
jgi:catechol-2,3-dioxygenase